MILIDYFIFGTYHFMMYMGKNKDDAKFIAILWGIMMFEFAIGAFAEMYIVLNGMSTDYEYITNEGNYVMICTYPILLIIGFLYYYVLRKKRLESLEIKYKSLTTVKRRILKWVLILAYLLVIGFSFGYQRYIDHLFR